MDTAYRLVERWFYFIDGLSYDFNDNKCKRIARYSTIPGSMIYTYLCVLYHVESLSDKRAEEHPIYKKELNIIDNDMRFVQEDHSNSEIEQRVKGYMEYKFWE
ncbi:MAG: hypothetical protein K2N44_05120 [Lachnospiraceae bacterium]|nr:hypothetical protein [Lachnospiraceae bacterium]